ncbi:GNAT family N-acetyltransferase, partial [Streptosporangium subroseum]
AVPEDIEALRRTDPGAATAWRHAVRDVLGGLMGEGARVTGFVREGGYIVERRVGDEPPPP